MANTSQSGFVYRGSQSGRCGPQTTLVAVMTHSTVWKLSDDRNDFGQCLLFVSERHVTNPHIRHVTPAVTPGVEKSRVIVTAFLSVSGMWKEYFEQVFSCFVPRGFESVVAQRKFLFQYSHVWFRVEETFEKPEQTQDSSQERTNLCHFHL
ncbi:hypothetical protein RB213_001693 [Colletotrichum asianum]